jgi:zinc transporter 9
MAHDSRKAVLTALVANTLLTVLKFFAALLSHSASMMNEAIHSLMDSLNQAFLFIGLKVAEKPPDEHYAFGHGQKKYLWNLWSAIGLFSIGCGLGLAHAWHSWHSPPETRVQGVVEFFGLSFGTVGVVVVVLGIALLLDGYSLMVALREFRKSMADKGETRFLHHMLRSDDPTLVAVVLEDSVATFGVLLAAAGITLAAVFDNPLWDAGFSAMIAILLGFTAFFLGAVNMRYLADVRDRGAEAVFAEMTRQHDEVERFHDLRSIILDDRHTILVAQVELREEAVIAKLQPSIRAYEAKYLAVVPEKRRKDPKVQDYCRARAAAQATLERAETIIKELEADIKARLPRVDHVTIEVAGIIAPRPDGEET